MANWVTNRIFIRGNPEKIKEVVGNQYSPFSFNKILPRPKELNIDGDTNEQLFIFMTNKCTKPISEVSKQKRNLLLSSDKQYFTKPLREILQQVKDYPPSRLEKEYILGGRKYQNIIKFGFPDWGSWCDANWGTKWESHEAELFFESDKELGYMFQSAFVFPKPIIQYLSDVLKTKITCLYTDEDLGLSCGFLQFNKGKHTKEWYPKNEILRVLFSAEIEGMGEYIIEDMEEWEDFEEEEAKRLEMIAANLEKYFPKEVYEYMKKK